MIQAFDENIYDGAGDSARIRPTWKYLLAETQAELDGLYDPLDPTKTKTRGSNPFATYGCRFYTLGGNGTGTDPDKGINGLIENMKNNMNRVKLSQLDQDGMVDMDDTWLGTDIPAAVKAIVPEIASVEKYGDLTITQLTVVVQKITAGM